MDLLTRQLADVRRRYPGTRIGASPDGQRLLVVPGVPAGVGWSAPTVEVLVLIPAGYPHVHPDCFYTEAGFRLASGAEPNCSFIQPILGGQYRWFSWHLGVWDPVSGTLDRYIRFCESRLKEAR
jgi:Prokaryotic E2 family E